MFEYDKKREEEFLGQAEAGKERQMLFELSIIPIGRESHLSNEIAKVLEEIEASRLPYVLTPTGTCIEGAWKEVMPLVEKCHNKVRAISPHVVTNIKIEDDVEDEGQGSKLERNILSVEEKVGHRLRTSSHFKQGDS